MEIDVLRRIHRIPVWRTHLKISVVLKELMDHWQLLREGRTSYVLSNFLFISILREISISFAALKSILCIP